MQFIRSIFESIDNIKDYVVILFIIISWIIGLLQKDIFGKFQKRKIKKLLSLKKNRETNFIVPIRLGRLEEHTLYGQIEEHKGDTTLNPNIEYYVNRDEVESMNGIRDTISGLYTEKKTVFTMRIISDRSNLSALELRSNLFCIGGPLANRCVSALFEGSDLGKDFSGFRKLNGKIRMSLIDKHNEYEKNAYVNTTLIERVPDTPGQILSFYYLSAQRRNNDDMKWKKIDFARVLENNHIDGGFIILVKIAGESFNNIDDHGTFHICFGYNAEDSKKASTCYSDFTNELYSHLKKAKHLDEFFIFIKTSGGEINFDNDHYFDLTEVMIKDHSGK